MESLLVPDDFERHLLFVAMVHHSDHLSERSTPEHPQYLISIADVIIQDDFVVCTIVVKSVVLRGHFCLRFLRILAQKVDFRVDQNLAMFEGGQRGGVLLECLARSEWKTVWGLSVAIQQDLSLESDLGGLVGLSGALRGFVWRLSYLLLRQRIGQLI